MGLLSRTVRAIGKGLTKVAQSTKRVNERFIIPITEKASKFDPASRGLMRTGWFKHKGVKYNPVVQGWKGATQKGPASKTGRVVLPIAGGIVGGFFGTLGGPAGTAAGAGAGAGFGRALAGVHSGERAENTYKAAGWSAAAGGATAGAASGAGALGAGIAGRAGAGMATSAAVQKAQGVPNRQIAYNTAASAAGLAGGYAGGYAGSYGGHLMSGTQLGAQVGGIVGEAGISQAARFAVMQAAMKQVAQSRAYSPFASPAMVQTSSTPLTGFNQRFNNPTMNPQTRRSLYSHLR